MIAVAAVPTTFIWSAGEKPDNIRSYNTVSAANVDIPVDEKVSWRIYLISSTVNAAISFMDTVAAVVCSENIICSPTINVPDVCETANSCTPVDPLTLARNPFAPLAKPLILVPIGFELAIAVHFNMVYVWISYKCKSNSVVLLVYDASVTLNEYTLASPISNPLTAVPKPFLLLYNLTTFVLLPPTLIKGDPVTLFTLIILPISNGINAVSTVAVVLGLSASITSTPENSTSNPLT